MHIIRKWIRNLFGFSGREINGFLVLLPLVVVILFSQPVYHWYVSTQSIDLSSDTRYIDSLAQLWTKPTAGRDTALANQRFPFDPNVVHEEDLIRLGFSGSLSKRIASYRAKGGKFRVKSDLLKIYGMDSSLYRSIRGFVTLPDKLTEEKRSFGQPSTVKTQLAEKKSTFVAFDINRADTTQLKSVYGIGSKLARRIINFREALGGFTNENQIVEVYGLDSALVRTICEQSFIANDFEPIKLDINSASDRELSAHPYIGKNLAKRIIAYRFQHGAFSHVDDLKKISQLDEALFQKIRPYVMVKK